MSISAERGPLNRCSFLHPIIPEYDLTGISSAQNQVRVELGEAGRHDGTLTVEHILGGVFLELSVPHNDHSVRLVGRLFVIVIGSYHQLRMVR